MKIIFLFLTLPCFIYSLENKFYVEIPTKDFSEIKELRLKGYDIGGINLEEKTISLILKKNELKYFNIRNIHPIEATPDPDYKNPDEVIDELLKIEEKYPHLSRVNVIGKSIEGRDIYAINITDIFFIPQIYPKPTILIDALHHAREVMTTEIALDIAQYLTENFEKDDVVRTWLQNYSIWIVPMVNPDGSNKVWTTDSMWRKNTRGGYGVDINRNYPYDWGACDGSSSSKYSDIYRGESAASEPETNALIELTKKIKPIINLSYHSYSEIVIYPFGCKPKKIPSEDRELYEKIGEELAKTLIRDSGNGYYKSGTSYELLYNVDGGSIDWMYGQNRTFSYVVEVNSSSQGFQPSFKNWRDRTVKNQRPGWQYLLTRIKDILGHNYYSSYFTPFRISSLF